MAYLRNPREYNGVARYPHCKHGHPLTPENTYINPKKPGSFICRTCARTSVLVTRYKKKGLTKAQITRALELRQPANHNARLSPGPEPTKSSGRPTFTDPYAHRPPLFKYRPRTVAALCHNGHEFTHENTYTVPRTGKRQCRTCTNDRARARLAERKSQHARIKRELSQTMDIPADPPCLSQTAAPALSPAPVSPVPDVPPMPDVLTDDTFFEE